MNRVISPFIRNGRDDLNGKSPYEVFAFLYGEDILKKLGVRLIPADKIVLKPSLLKGGSHEDS